MNDDMKQEFAEFKEQLINDINEEKSDERLGKQIFLDKMLEYLPSFTSEWEEDPEFYSDDRIQGSYHSDDWDEIDILISEYFGQNRVRPSRYSTPDSIKNRFRAADVFIQNSFKGVHTQMEVSQELRGFAEAFYHNQERIHRIRYILITDADVPDVEISSIEREGYVVEYHVWSLEKIYDIFVVSSDLTDLEIDLVEFNERIPCMKVDFGDEADYTCYLGCMSGNLLALLYEKYNARLLEGNIRVFLQTKSGSVNKGIKSTLRNETEKKRFFAYNNGISATAKSVVLSEPDSSGLCCIEKISGLQIVNGGQTTASMHNAKKECVSLDGVYVQLKLTIPREEEKLKDLIPNISKYSNTQNKINEADFSANDEFQVALEKLSRSTRIPGSGQESYWFYERTRGQYGEAERLFNLKGKMEQKTLIPFGEKYPKSRKITKTELSIYCNAWNQHPDHAAKGGEKSFSEFYKFIQSKGKDKEFYVSPDERYFRELIAITILFIRLDSKVADLQKNGSRYGKGYKREIVVYTLALFSYLTKGMLNLEKIWNYQVHHGSQKKSFTLPPEMESYLDTLILIAEEHTHTPPPSERNAREWAKKAESWTSLKNKQQVLSLEVPTEFSDKYYLSDSEMEERNVWFASIWKQPEDTNESNNHVELSLCDTSNYDSSIPVSDQQSENTEIQPQKPCGIRLPDNPRSFLERSSVLEMKEFMNMLGDSGLLNDDMLNIFSEISSFRSQRKQCPKVLLDAGVKLLDLLKEEPDSLHNLPEVEQKFTYATKNAIGEMVIRNGKYIVLSGCTVAFYEAFSIKENIQELRDNLVREGKLIRTGTPPVYILKEDVSFDTSGDAASFVAGNNSSGNVCWKAGDIPLRDYLKLNGK